MSMPADLVRRLDFCPVWLAWPAGIGGGLLMAVAVLTWAPALLGAVLFVLLLGGAVALAWGGEPVAVLEAVPQGTLSSIAPVSEPVPALPELTMVPIPGGVLQMGSPEDEPGRRDNEGPLHEVRVSALTMMQVPVT